MSNSTTTTPTKVTATDSKSPTKSLIDIPNVLVRGVGCDVKIVALDGKEFEAHWLALSRRIEFFKGMWRCGMKEVKEGRMTIEVSSDAVEFILKWVYGEDYSDGVLEDTLKEVVLLAMYWECESIGKEAMDCMADVDIELQRCLIIIGLCQNCGICVLQTKFIIIIGLCKNCGVWV